MTAAVSHRDTAVCVDVNNSQTGNEYRNTMESRLDRNS